MPAPCGLVLQAKSDPLPTRYRSNPSSAEAYDHRDLGATNTECLLNGGQSKSRIRSREEKKPGTRPTSVSKVHAPRVLGNRAPEAAVSQQSPFMQSAVSHIHSVHDGESQRFTALDNPTAHLFVTAARSSGSWSSAMPASGHSHIASRCASRRCPPSPFRTRAGRSRRRRR